MFLIYTDFDLKVNKGRASSGKNTKSKRLNPPLRASMMNSFYSYESMANNHSFCVISDKMSIEGLNENRVDNEVIGAAIIVAA